MDGRWGEFEQPPGDATFHIWCADNGRRRRTTEGDGEGDGVGDGEGDGARDFCDADLDPADGADDVLRPYTTLLLLRCCDVATWL